MQSVSFTTERLVGFILSTHLAIMSLMLMFLFTHDLFCKQLSYEIQEIRDSLFALHRYLDGGFACLLVFPNAGKMVRD